MAARTGAGVGVGVTITILGVLSLTLFILTIVFLSKYQAAQKNLTATLAENEAIIKASERGLDEITRLRDLARQDGNQSVVGYLNASLKAAMERATGNSRDTVAELERKIQNAGATDASSLLAAVRARDAQIVDLTAKLEQADAARRTALADLQNEVERVAQIEASHQQTLAALQEQLDRYRQEVDQYRTGTNEVRAKMDEAIEQCRQEAEDQRLRLTSRIDELQRENLILLSQVQELRRDRGQDILRPQAEEALVDGRIAGVSQGDQQVFISLGARDRVRIGMQFAVYSEPTAIKVDERTGEYARPKAQIEIINVGERSSTCRVIWETRGNPVIKGDVIANPVYDPKKVYTFLLFGNFDSNGDGQATEAEGQDVRAMIEAWGGRLSDELTGDVDFLILGAPPVVPPPPTPDTPIEVFRHWNMLNQQRERYNDLLEKARATSLPVLNENRLYTLIGRR